METNLSSWLRHQLSHPQSSYLNSSNYPFNLGSTKDIPPSMSPCANIASSNGTLSEIAFSGIPYPQQYQPNISHGWFNSLPHYRQAYNDVANISSAEKAPYFSGNEEANTTNPGSGPAQKRFLVFDQSGDQTTMFFSPAIGPHVQLPSAGPKLNYDYDVKKMVETDKFQHQEPILTYEYHPNRQDDAESEMREDTEELNALLYSDDEYYYEDEEETSTGHSPSTMTEFENHEWAENNEEVGCNFGSNKRVKLSQGCFEVSPVAATETSDKLKYYSECEDDAESSCGLVGKKRVRKDHIRDTVSLLQRIIPGGKGKGKDVILIFDDAIDYLKSLKVKAQALGVDMI